MTVYGLIVAFLSYGLSASAQTASPDAGPNCVGGTSDSPIQIEVFSDYQCPACRAFYLQTMRSVLSDYADAGKVCVVYREFPLPQHPYARQAARYALAARRLGHRQWTQVTEALYNAQDKWAEDGALEPIVASALSAEEMERVREWARDPAIDATITSDIALARKLQVNSTPTFFVTANGKTEKVAAAIRYPILSRYLDNLLRQ